MSRTTTQITRTADWLLEAHDPLAELVYKGTPRPWKQTDLTADQRAELDAQARAERAESDGTHLPETPAPIHLDVLDDLTHQQHTARATATRIAAALGDHTMHVQLTRQTDAPTIDTIRYIKTAAEKLHPDRDAQLLAATTHTLHRMRTATARHLTEVTEGQRLKAHCPWCHYEHLRIRTIGPEHRPDTVVRCESDRCDPPPKDCGTWHWGRPCWPLHEWEWLAKIINWANSK